jgi:hypothetical protein
MITSWDYIKQLFQPTDRIAIYMRKKAHPIQQRILSAEKASAEPFQLFLRHQNAQGADIWISVNPLRPDAKSRTKNNIAEIRRLYLDIDDDGEAVLHAILTNTSLPQPNYVLNTSEAKYQVLWNVTGFSSDSAEKTTRALARFFSADTSVFDVSRVLRLPGFQNKKYPAPFRITATRLSTRIYQPGDFTLPPELFTDIPPTAATATKQPTTSSTTGPDTSPSGLDWGYCCKSIWRAMRSHQDLDTFCAGLISELEQRAKARRKPDPSYYAHRTVKNARIKIANQHMLRPRKGF